MQIIESKPISCNVLEEPKCMASVMKKWEPLVLQRDLKMDFNFRSVESCDQALAFIYSLRSEEYEPWKQANQLKDMFGFDVRLEIIKIIEEERCWCSLSEDDQMFWYSEVNGIPFEHNKARANEIAAKLGYDWKF